MDNVPETGSGTLQNGCADFACIISRGLVAIFVLASVASAGDFLGAAACAPCHREQYERQNTSHHARALRPILDTPLARILTERPLREKGGISFDYQLAMSGLTVTVHRDREEASGILEWTFGAGAQGFTPVGRVNGRYFEHRISWYAAPNRPGVTFGHPADPLESASAALGRMQGSEAIYRCFNCHGTGVKPGPDLSSMHPGVTCERCHGPGRDHAAQRTAKSIFNAGRFPARTVVQMCGECHRLPGPGTPSSTPERDDPVSVRFAPVGLVASKCFQSSGKLSCLTCHDPHDDARRVPEFYMQKCLGCHGIAVSPGARCKRASKQDCLPCHMPRTAPVRDLRFTDHRIRIVNTAAVADFAPVEEAIAAADFARAHGLLEQNSPSGARWHLLASRIFNGLNDPARAVAEAQAALEIEPRNEAHHLQLAQIFLDHNTPKAALEVLADAQPLFPESLLIRLGKGLALKDLQRYDAAENEFKACLARNPRLTVAFDALAGIYLQTSRYEDAARLSATFLETASADYRGYYYLAAAKEGLKENLAEAESLLRESLRRKTNFAAAHALLGKVLLESDRAAEAVPELEEAIRLRPNYSPAYLYLGNACHKLGREQEAARAFAELRKLKEKEREPVYELQYHRGRAPSPQK